MNDHNRNFIGTMLIVQGPDTEEDLKVSTSSAESSSLQPKAEDAS
jgi:hypothetical protein